jgi:uncharacterized protein involved in response to NO
MPCPLHGGAEPWRPFFLVSFATGAVAGALWAAQLAGLPVGMDVPTHVRLLLWGAFGAGVAGFLLTAYPRQNGLDPLPVPAVVALAAAHLLGQALLLASLLRPEARPLADATTLLGSGALTLVVVRMGVTAVRRSRELQPAVVALGMVALLLGQILVVASHPAGFGVGAMGGLVLVAVGFLDRILPFFTSRVLPGYTGVRRPGFLAAWTTLSALSLAAGRSWGAPWLEAALWVLLAWAWWGWRPRAAFRVPMIAVLHLGVLWVLAGLAIDATSRVGAPFPVGAGMHALLLGGVGTLFWGLSMRVALGHSGLPIRMLPAGGVAVGLLQLAVVARVASGDARVQALGASLFACSCVLWLATFGPLCLPRARPVPA